MTKLFKLILNTKVRQTSLFFSLFVLLIFCIFQVSASPAEVSSPQSIETVQGGVENFSPLVAYLSQNEAVPPTEAPIIVSFVASADTITSGDSADLSWEVAGQVTSITIDNSVGEVENVGVATVSPTETTTYALTAVNSAGSNTAEVTITVEEEVIGELPTINSFTASDTTIEEGDSTTLNWSASNYDTLRINKGIGDVTNQNSIVVTPTEDTTYRLTAFNDAGNVAEVVSITVNPPSSGGGGQIEIYDWNGNVTQADRGFPRNQPPKENGNWVSPVNYAGGTLYVRAQINSQPVPQDDMRLQFCFWQEKGGNNFALETCITTQNVPGTPGTVECWSSPIQSMWKLGGKSLEWYRPRYRVAAVVKKGNGDPVSDYNGWNWNGENPEHWYPLNMRFTVIVVPQGGTFSGWGSYGGGC